MKKEGFTLIELLAVIVILAIIALIATPAVLNIIEDSRRSATSTSAKRILKAAENYMVSSKINNELTLEGNIYNSVIKNVDGELPDFGEIFVNDENEISAVLKYENYCYGKWYDEEELKELDAENCYIPVPKPTVSFNVLNDAINSNGYSTTNFEVEIKVENAISYKYCKTTTTCEPNQIVEGNTNVVLIDTESVTNRICVKATDLNNQENDVICSDNFKLSRTVPTIKSNSMNYVVVTPGTSVNVIDYFDYSPASGKTISHTSCKINGEEVENTSSLAIGEYEVTCEVFQKENGASNKDTIKLGVNNCYDFSSGTIKYYNCYEGNPNGYEVKSDVVVPNSINQKKVTSIGSGQNSWDQSFAKKNLVSVDLSNAIELSTIDYCAFCQNMIAEVKFGDLSKLRRIEAYAFIGNQIGGILDFKDYKKLTYIGWEAFSSNQIEKVYFPESIEELSSPFPNNQLSGELDLSSFTKLTTIGGFYNNNIESVKLPVTITAIYGSAFQNNNISGELDLTYLENLEELRSSAFARNSIESLKLPKTISKIEDYTFQNNSLKNIDFINNDNITSIGKYAFSSNQLESLDLSKLKDLETIGKSAFAYNKIKNLEFGELSKLKVIEEDTFNTNEIENTLDFSKLTNLVTIGNWAFYNNKNLSSINFSNLSNLTSIGSYSFYGANITGELDFSDMINLTTIGKNAFHNSSISGTLDLSNTKLTYIEGFADNKIEKLLLPSTIIEISDSAFSGNNLKGTLDLSNLNNLTTIGNMVFYNNEIENIILNNDSLETIGELAFAYNRIKNLDLKDMKKLEEIKNSAFTINDLTEVKLPNSLKLIGSDVFTSHNNKSIMLQWKWYVDNPNLSLIEIDNIEGAIEGAPWGENTANIVWLR